MLDVATKTVSIATLAILYLMALFNIGYFYVIGFHFIGVIDISNIVYSFGLVFFFVVLFLVLAACVSLLMDWIASLWPRLSKPIQIMSAILFLLLLLTGAGFLVRIDPRDISGPSLLLMCVVLMTILGRISHHEWKKSGKLDRKFVYFFIVMATLAPVIGGIAVVRQQLEDDARYEVITKSGGLSKARMLRSSSSGFILEYEGRILFVPSGEVRSVSGPIAKRR